MRSLEKEGHLKEAAERRIPTPGCSGNSRAGGQQDQWVPRTELGRGKDEQSTENCRTARLLRRRPRWWTHVVTHVCKPTERTAARASRDVRHGLHLITTCNKYTALMRTPTAGEAACVEQGFTGNLCYLLLNSAMNLKLL